MKLQHETQKKTHWLRSRRTLAILFGLAVLLAIGFAKAYFKEYASIREIRQLQEEARRIEFEKVSLFELLQYVETNAYAEEEARAKLQYKKPGEEVIIFTDVNATSTPSVREKKSNVLLWWEYFFGGLKRRL